MLGTDSMAGWTAFNKFDDYYWPISNAIGIAVMTYVGQNFGAGDRERVHESIHKGLLIHLTTSALFSVIIFSGRYPMMHLFVGDDPTVIAIGAQVTALIAPCYVLFTLVEVLSSTMRGVGDAVVPAAHHDGLYLHRASHLPLGLRLLAQLQPHHCRHLPHLLGAHQHRLSPLL